MEKVKRISFTITTLLVIMLLSILGVRDNTKVHNIRENESSTIVKIIEGREVANEESPAGVVTEFELQLDMDLTHEKDMMFYVSHQWAEVYIGNECVYRLERSQELPFIKTPGSKWVRIPLYTTDEGKTVKVVTTPAYSNHVKKEIEIFIGSSLAIYRDQFQQMLPVILLSVLNILVGMLLLFATIYYRSVEKEDTELLSLGLLGITIGFWRLAHNDFSPFLLEKKEIFLYYLSVTMMLVMMIPLVGSAIKKISEGKRKIMQYYMIAVSMLASIQIILQLAGVRDLREMFLFTHASILIGAILLIAVVITDIIKNRKNSREKSYIWVLAVGLIGDLVVYYLTGTAANLTMTTTSLLIYMLLEGFGFLMIYFKQRERLRENELQLKHSLMMLSMSQIRSHFVFNVLNAISGMCKYDPEKADETIVRFSRYLRNNIDMMEEDKMIPFETELQRLEDYMILEQVRFGERLEFVTDIEVTDFMMPSLILQPIIENSIKHGITKKKSGGTILLSTWKEDGNIMISVDDDGVGFEMEELEKSTSIGIKNIRYRLNYLLDGTLTIRSEIDKGTKATISFPEQRGDKECM